MTDENGTGSIGNSPGNGEAPTGLDPNWVIVLIGSRTLLGKLTFQGSLEPAYELQMRPVPQQQIDPRTKQPVMTMGRARSIMPVAEMEGWFSLSQVPPGAVIKPVHELAPVTQAEMRQAVVNIEAAIAAAERKQKIDAEAVLIQKAGFGGGARKEL